MTDIHVQFGDLCETIKGIDPARNDKYAIGNDTSSGRLFADVFSSFMKFCPENKGWYIYDGKVWILDTGEIMVEDLSKKLFMALTHYSVDTVVDSDYRKFIAKLGNRPARERMLKDAKSFAAISSGVFNQNFNLFNCQNGTFDFSTGELKPYNSTDYLTKLSNVIYDPDAKSDLWEKFVSDIMCEDSEKIAYLQKCLGYGISGNTQFECFFITYGKTTRNGKGTLDGTIRHMCGDYAGVASPDAFASSKLKAQGDKPNDTIVSIHDRHYISVSEPDEAMLLNSAYIKQLTGNDAVRARGLYQTGIEFTPRFKLWFNTNYLPQVSDETIFASNRVIVIPFDRHFAPDEQDIYLKEKLKAPPVISACFNWCYDGYRKAIQDKLTMPDFIRNAVDQYAVSQNRIDEFIDECFLIEMDGKIRFSDVYKAYNKFCVENGYKPYARNRFKSKAGERLDIRSYAGQDHVFGKAWAKDCPFIE